MLVRKLTVAGLEVGKVCVAYSAKSKMLSSNGKNGVFVLIEEIKGKDVKVKILGLDKSMVIKNVDGRQDAWIYSPDDTLKIKIKGAVGDKKGVTFTQRVFDLYHDKERNFDMNAVYKHERDDEHKGKIFYRFRGEDEKFSTLHFGWVFPVVEPEWRVPRAQRMGIGAVEIKLPPKPVGAEEEELLTKLSAAIKEFNKNKQPLRVASFIGLDDKGKIIGKEYSGPCHAALDCWNGVHYILSCHPEQRTEGTVSDNVVVDYINFLTNYSNFKDAFLIKDADWILKNCYILTGEVSAQLVAGACMATRQIQEHPQVVLAWHGLMKQGIDANMAFIFGCSATIDNKGGMLFNASNYGHIQFAHRSMSDDNIINYLDGKIVIQNDLPYKSKSNYRGVDRMWGELKDSSSIWDRLNNVGGKGTGWQRKYLPIEDACEQAADVIEAWMKENGV